MLLFALLGLVCAVANADSAGCTAELQNINNAFTHSLNIGADLNWKNVEGLRAAVEKKFSDHGPVGLREVCYAFFTYRTALTKYRDCFGVLPLISTNGAATGVTRKQAYDYYILMAQIDYACGGGYEIFTNQDSCIAQTFVTRKDDLKKCRYTFDDENSADGQNLCMYFGKFIECYRDIFRNCNEEAAFFGCEYARVGLHFHYQQCSDKFCFVNHKFT
ncbi:hypothetical protein L596_003564 [Steinernema carpocapsae]|uniref:DUF19 domain-containing protein n=1 Tax=Steinernema carpocapsae TaxID=34508 RepID=A0A4U8UUL7_STECR|nr:hypothetical protein L596_003564 [Steinernema carpocapsae]